MGLELNKSDSSVRNIDLTMDIRSFVETGITFMLFNFFFVQKILINN